MNELRINGERLWQSLMDLAAIGATEKGGVKRLASNFDDTFVVVSGEARCPSRGQRGRTSTSPLLTDTSTERGEPGSVGTSMRASPELLVA